MSVAEFEPCQLQSIRHHAISASPGWAFANFAYSFPYIRSSVSVIFFSFAFSASKSNGFFDVSGGRGRLEIGARFFGARHCVVPHGRLTLSGSCINFNEAVAPPESGIHLIA
jgi:hypothetical protein